MCACTRGENEVYLYLRIAANPVNLCGKYFSYNSASNESHWKVEGRSESVKNKYMFLVRLIGFIYHGPYKKRRVSYVKNVINRYFITF